MAFYPLTPELAKKLRHLDGMHTGAWQLWSYLVTLDPFGDAYQELPPLVDILSECDISRPTFYRAMALFIEHEIFDLQPGKLFFRNLCGKGIVSPTRLDSHPRESQSHPRESQSHPRESESPEPPSNKDRQCTNNRSRRSLKQTNREDPPTRPVQADSLRSIDSEGFGTRSEPYKQDIEALIERVKAARVRPNKTIQETILETLENEGAAAGAKAVENAISSLEEARAKGIVKNPGGFLVAALQKKFTANYAKKDARHKRENRKPPSLNEVEMQVDSYLLSGKRDWALNKLQSLWDEGLHDALEAVCTLRTDWGFALTSEGIRDAHAT